jgi:outer membrane protein assembly factor BamB
VIARAALLFVAGSASAAPLAHRPTVLASQRLAFTSSTAPAVGDVDGDGLPDFAVTTENIGDKTRDLDDPKNVNAVTVFHWKSGRLEPLPGWPRKTRDATLGLAMADLDGDGRDEILASCGQDTSPALMTNAGLWLSSRLYVWRGSGEPMKPWYPSDPNGVQGLIFGHAYAAPVVADLNGDGHPQILQTSQGVWGSGGFERGSMRIWSAKGSIFGQTQGDTANLPWHTLPGFAMDTPAALAHLGGAKTPSVVAGTYDGKVYAWGGRGAAAPGWFPSPGAATNTRNGALLRGTIAAADLDGDGMDEIIAGGYDGALYRWSAKGALRFRSQLPGSAPPGLTSGVAVGRLRRGMKPEWDIVAGDAQGNVNVWAPDGKMRWRASTTPGSSIEAEPAIGDVNADGTQDVVVGGSDGYVYAFDGETGGRLWQTPTFWAPTLDGMRLESVFGTPALCDLRGNGHLNIVVATAQRYIADVPTHTWKGFGHVLVLDCGPRTFDKRRLDWPQYRQNKRRTGRVGM